MIGNKHVVLSGIRATGHLHLGNFLGVLENFARMSADPSKLALFFVADLHTLTTFKEANLIRTQAPEIVLDMLAAGVDPEKSVIYVQSSVPVVTELSWYLACIAAAGDLQRMPTYKDKSSKQPEDVNAGLLFYPILMAADILGPRADLVPIGKDQKPHLEFTAQIARNFNMLYREFFPIPEELTGQEDNSLSVPGLVAMDEEGRFSKMGKSEAPEQTLYLNDDPNVNAAKVLKAPTDPARQRRTDKGTPQKCVIYQLHTLVSSDDQLRYVVTGCTTAGIGCAECKNLLNENLDNRLQPFRERRKALAAHPEQVQEILHEGQKKANALFTETTQEVADRMGVYRLEL